MKPDIALHAKTPSLLFEGDVLIWIGTCIFNFYEVCSGISSFVLKGKYDMRPGKVERKARMPMGGVGAWQNQQRDGPVTALLNFSVLSLSA